jgi:hypothetical protein
VVNVGIDIKDIPKIDDKDFSVTLNAFFVVQWTDERLLIDQEQVTDEGPLPRDDNAFDDAGQYMENGQWGVGQWSVLENPVKNLKLTKLSV